MVDLLSLVVLVGPFQREKNELVGTRIYKGEIVRTSEAIAEDIDP